MAKHGFKVLWQRYIDKKSKQLACGEPGRRERIRRTISAVLEAAAWQRANRSEAVKIIATRYRISQNEAERSYDTMTGIFSPDGAMHMKKVRGYLSLLREERPIPEELDPEKLVDFSMLPSAR